ncbi:helix-turn-helix domain-containing protein [Pontibacter fetidus]|uniref:Helix-turn-helix transcriptional regulator n=1 Tax=Pontibacter fetidus TaxID=2700082 RepID=A0A6B2GZP9_9BACT|nr:helix-turn-helix transcriptional regulator [Pontibacter fetidus]NDK56345.1 helix-turn-helix transcriptional regulator [Pontibacter fetidus]
MVDRIRQLIEFTGLSVSQFADGIDVPRAILSHILGGRNKPSLDVMLKVIAAYRNINPDWLLLGEGDMLIKVATVTTQPDSSNPTETIVAKNPEPVANIAADIAKVQNELLSESNGLEAMPTGKQVKQIVFFYTDNTFSIFEPGS